MKYLKYLKKQDLDIEVVGVGLVAGMKVQKAYESLNGVKK